MEEFETKVKIKGTVTDITFHNDVNGYTVFSVDIGDEELTAVGTVFELHEGDRVELLGDFTYHERYGRQFKAELCTVSLPQTTEELYRFLASGTVKGIRASTAEKIIDRFGEKSFYILECEPERLAEIRGISLEKAKKIGIEYKKQASVRSLIISLTGYGLTTAECILAYEKLGQGAVERIEENPYLLCEGEKRLSFERAEQIAEKLPKKPDYMNRAVAGMLYVITHNFYNGHTCVPLDKLFTPGGALLGESEETLQMALEQLKDEKRIVTEEISGREFVFLPNAYNAEKGIARRLSVLLKFPPENPIEVERYIEELEKKHNISYAESQKTAIITAVNRGILILTGGPGTGKTTTLNGIISMFEKDNLRIALCAPTGRAAQRVTEATGRQAGTIHRLLEVEWDADDRQTFKRNLRNPLEYEAVIVDEMSMVDIFLFQSLLDALPFGCRLIMLGDSDQLPSVSAGNVLGDLIACKLLPTVKLTEIFRQALDSNIVKNAHAIVGGKMIETDYSDGDFFVVKRPAPSLAAKTVAELVCTRLPDAYGLDPLNQIQVLCPSKKGETGTLQLNKALQELLNPHAEGKAECPAGARLFRTGDKVMQTKNNYNIHWESESEEGDGIFNGDIGYITAINHKDGIVKVDFSGKTAVFTKDQRTELELAYAVTVHKSQGSEFDAVVMPAVGVNPKLCYRNLLYTAVTRAKKLMVLVGTADCIGRMIENTGSNKRFSALKKFMLDNSEKGSIM